AILRQRLNGEGRKKNGNKDAPIQSHAAILSPRGRLHTSRLGVVPRSPTYVSWSACRSLVVSIRAASRFCVTLAIKEMTRIQRPWEAGSREGQACRSRQKAVSIHTDSITKTLHLEVV